MKGKREGWRGREQERETEETERGRGRGRERYRYIRGGRELCRIISCLPFVALGKFYPDWQTGMLPDHSLTVRLLAQVY